MSEKEGTRLPDICGAAVDLINGPISGSKHISIAIIYIDPGKQSIPHYHKNTEEIYYFLEGNGRTIIEGETIDVGPGSVVFLPLFKRHQVINDSQQPLKFLSSDAPPYDPADVYF